MNLNNQPIKSILILFAVLLSFNSFSQGYENYYRLCNEGDSLKYIDSNQSALSKYKQAFNSVKYVHSKKYKKAYDLAIKMNSYEDAFLFGRMMLINSGELSLVHTRSIKFKSSKYYHYLKDSSDFYIEKCNKRINHSYIKIIDSLFYIDQRIIRNNKFVTGKYMIDKSKLPIDLYSLDHSNWKLLYLLIDSLGFPTEEMVGADACGKVFGLLHHNLRLKENEKYHKEFFEYTRLGYYLPEDNLAWYEQYNTWFCQKTFFTTFDGDLTPENLKRIDNNLRMFYLKGINSYQIKKNGRSMSLLW